MKSQSMTSSTADSQRLTRLGYAVIYLITGVIVLNFARIALSALAMHLDWSGQTANLVYFGPLLAVLLFNGYTVIRIGDRTAGICYLLMGIILVAVHAMATADISDGPLQDLQTMLDGMVYILLSVIFYRVIRLLMNTDQQRKQRLLENLAWGTSHRVGTDFLSGLVSTIVETLNVQLAIVSEIDPESPHEMILSAAAATGQHIPDDLQPGEEVVCEETKLRHTTAGQSLYIIDLTDAEENPIGHLSLFHADSEEISPGQRSSLQVFASRASAELLRIRADRKSDEMEARMLQVQKLESLGVLAGGIAHDFNNLLHAIRSYAAVAGEVIPEKTEARTAIEQIEGVVDKGATMCNRLLAYAGRAVRCDDVCRINAIVTETAGIIQAARSDCHVTLRLSPRPLNVWGDATQLSQVVMNLLTNAADAIDGEHGEIEVCTTTGDHDCSLAGGMQLEDSGEYAFIEVNDNGCGIDDHFVMKIFDPFYTTKGKGRGIGLASVAGIVRDHQGDIAIRSERQIGTKFIVALRNPCRNEPTTHQPPMITRRCCWLMTMNWSGPPPACCWKCPG